MKADLYYISEQGQKFNLESPSLSIESKGILKTLIKKNCPMSTYALKLILSRNGITRSWKYLKFTIEELEKGGLVIKK